jgi:Cu-Zn family superoxide dismutase
VAFVPHDGELQVYVDITGLSPGLHGLHVHEKGDCSAPDFSSAGEHFAPRDQPHGDPYSGEHHAGDLGNLDANDEGQVSMRLVAPDLTIERSAKNSALGRAVVVHADPDDLITQPSGGSGARIACGVIELYQPDQDAEEPFEPQAQ